MNKAGWLATAGLALALAATPARSEPLTDEPSPAFRRSGETLVQMAQAYDRDDCDSVLRLGRPLVVGRDLSALPGEGQSIAYEVVARCEGAKGRMSEAYALALRATSFEGSSDPVWRYRFSLELDAEKYEAAVATVEAMSQGRGAALNRMPINWLWILDGALKEGGNAALRRRLLAVLAADAYDPEEMFVPPDGFRFAYAHLLFESGERDRARDIVIHLKDPSLIARASLDPRFRGFLAADPDIRAAAEAELAAHREAMALHPDLLLPINNAAGDLRLLGRPREALALLQAAEGKVDDAGAFTDRADNLNWYWDVYAKIYQMLGRTDDMVRAYAKGGNASESGDKVSQLLNLGAAQLRAGRHDDALKTLDLIADRSRSPYGEMVLRLVRGCALSRAGRSAEAAADVSFAKAHEKDHRGGLSYLLLCVGDMDGAAALYIKRLEDPEDRTEVLLGFSDYDDPPVPSPPDPIDPLMEKLGERPDVKAAIERAGGTRRFNVQSAGL
jgi:Flp pilus assembly protein TadD